MPLFFFNFGSEAEMQPLCKFGDGTSLTYLSLWAKVEKAKSIFFPTIQLKANFFVCNFCIFISQPLSQEIEKAKGTLFYLFLRVDGKKVLFVLSIFAQCQYFISPELHRIVNWTIYWIYSFMKNFRIPNSIRSWKISEYQIPNSIRSWNFGF